ncbi:GNAT family N-acetyltransferase [Deltaproteobacteria bacterium]|nr:GNAT family N-acetyltransferase [Deltaproteobacteria bacterium]
MDKGKDRIIPDWKERFKVVIDSPEGAVKKIHPGHRVLIGTGCSQPSLLVNAMTDRAEELVDVEIIQMLNLGDAPYARKDLANSFRVNSFFVSENIRDSISQGLGNYTPIMISDIPRLFSNGQVPLDVSLIQVSPPDQRGMCSLGISVDVLKAAIENSKTVIAQVNSRMPKTFGDSMVSIYEIDVFVPVDEPLIEAPGVEIEDEERRIGEYVSSLIESGSTIQLGFGKVPQIVIDFLREKKDLGVHTEMITDGIIDLVESGAVNGRLKSLDRGKIVTSFCMGTKRLYDFVNNNKMFSFRRTEYVNDQVVIGQQNKMVAVNAALEVDLTGQVCADSLGTQFISGIGGQADFNRGANRSNRGKSIIALPATAKNGSVSRIVAQLTPGAGVVTTRGDVHYVVTEYGAAYLHGKNIQDRAMALISIAHPDYRAELLKKAIEYGYVVPALAEVEGKLFVSPRDLTTTMLLDDGTKIKFRPIHPTDAARMRDLFFKLSEAALYYRFGWNIKQLPRKQIQDFIYIDHRNEVGLVGTIPEAGDEEIIAFGGYHLDKKTNLAEVALVVQDEWQNRGIASFMIKYLARIARKDGIRGFTSEVHTANKTMQTLMHKLDGKMEGFLDGSVYGMRMDFL